MRTIKAGLKPSVLSWIYMMRIYSLVTRAAERELRAEGLTLPRFDVIVQLGALEGCCTQESLCDKLLVTKGNVSGLIQRMMVEGLVTRREDPENRRCNRVQLSENGKRLFRKVVPDHEGCIDALFSGLSRREQAELSELLGKLLAYIRKLGRKS